MSETRDGSGGGGGGAAGTTAGSGLARAGRADVALGGERDILDRYTLGSLATGVLLGLAGAGLATTAAIAIGIEAFENPLRKALPGAFPPPGTSESTANHASDVAAVLLGWLLVQLMPATPTPAGGDGTAG